MHKHHMELVYKWRNYGLLCAVLAVLGLIIEASANDYKLLNTVAVRNPQIFPNAMDDPYNNKIWFQICRLNVLFMTILAEVCLVLRHYYKN